MGPDLSPAQMGIAGPTPEAPVTALNGCEALAATGNKRVLHSGRSVRIGAFSEYTTEWAIRFKEIESGRGQDYSES